MTLKSLWVSAAIPSAFIFGTSTAFAQVDITDDRETPVRTSTVGTDGAASDVTVSGTLTTTSGPAVVVDSDNDVTVSGTISSNNADNTTGIELQGGNSGNLTLDGPAGGTARISLVEDYTPEDGPDEDTIADGAYAQGSGRTGILISGASPFAGEIHLQSDSAVTVEGNDSFGIRILDTAGLTGNLTTGGVINMIGTNARAISAEGNVTGNISNEGTIAVRGEGASAITVAGDVTGQVSNSGTITNTGFRFSSRPNLTVRNLLNDDDNLQANSALQINGNVTNGVFLQEVTSTTENDDGTTTTTLVRRSDITQQGSASAVLIDGNGTPIAIGRVAEITDPSAEGFDADLQYAFVNQGSVTANGTYDDINATVFEVRDATLEGGIRNLGTLQSLTHRSGDNGDPITTGETGISRVIVLGSGAIADAINNSGIILAQSVEAGDQIYADRSNVIAPRFLSATAIDIDANANLARLVNTSQISAIITGRDGEAIAVRDRSGTLTYIENSGSISAIGSSSDAQGLQDTSFNLIALDLSANTSGVTISQIAATDEDTTDDVTPADPSITGDILLGSGDDTVTASAGNISGDLSFGDGADSFTLSGGADYTGQLSDSDGNLVLAVGDGSVLTQSTTAAINTTSASFASGATFRPTLNGATGEASTLTSTGDITFAEGSSISPILTNVIDSDRTSFRILDAGGSLNLGGSLEDLPSGLSPFMYDTTYAIDPNDPNALIVTLDLRPVSELGLDSVQAASFGAMFQALEANTALANEFVNITEQSAFNSALNQLLPEFSAAARQFVVANVNGSTGAVATHLENARRSTDKPGGVWLQEFGYFADRDLAGLSDQYRGYGFGLSGGIDTAFGPFHTVGLNLGFASTEIEDVIGVDEPLDVMTFQLGAYAGLERGNLGVDGYVGYGFNDFESSRNVVLGDFSESAQGDWSGTHINGTLRAGYDLSFGERFWARPTVSLDYLRLSEKAYEETGATGVALAVDSRESEVGGVTAMLNFGATYMGKRTWIRPSMRVGYRHEFINEGARTNYRFVGLDTPASLLAADFPDSGFIVGFSLAAGSKYSSVGFDFDSDIRDGFVRHTGRLVIRLIF